MTACTRSSSLAATAVMVMSLGVAALRKSRESAEAAEGPIDGRIVMFRPGTTDAMIEAFCAGRCYSRGSPDTGGLAFALLRREEVQLVGWESDCIASEEQDAEVEDDPEEEDIDEEAPSVSWSLQHIGVPKAKAKGRGVNIYVLDSGVRATHREFVGRVVPAFNGFNEVGECNATDLACTQDTQGHGSHVAGSAAGTYNGVAPLATIYAMKRGGSMANAIRGMDFVARKVVKPAVLTMSFGGPGTSSAAEHAVDFVLSMGVPITVASGNKRWDACLSIFSYIPHVISVANSDEHNTRVTSSNYGPCTDIFAPGARIVSASNLDDSKLTTKTGTSMAAPHVAGAVALLLEINPTMSPQAVKESLKSSATKEVISDSKGSPNLLLNVAGFGFAL